MELRTENSSGTLFFSPSFFLFLFTGYTLQVIILSIFFPTLSFVHPMLQRRFPVGELSPEYLRAIIVAFPTLEYLSIKELLIAQREVIEKWDYFEHRLPLLASGHTRSFARARVKFLC